MPMVNPKIRSVVNEHRMSKSGPHSRTPQSIFFTYHLVRFSRDILVVLEANHIAQSIIVDPVVVRKQF